MTNQLTDAAIDTLILSAAEYMISMPVAPPREEAFAALRGIVREWMVGVASESQEDEDPPSISHAVELPSIKARVVETVIRPEFHVDYSEYESERQQVICPKRVKVVVHNERTHWSCLHNGEVFDVRHMTIDTEGKIHYRLMNNLFMPTHLCEPVPDKSGDEQ